MELFFPSCERERDREVRMGEMGNNPFFECNYSNITRRERERERKKKVSCDSGESFLHCAHEIEEKREGRR